jgi:hypothetical protein
MNYNTEIVLNPILLESDFDLNPIDLNVALDLGTVDFAIDVFTGSNVIIVDQVNADWDSTSGKSEILNKPYIPQNTGDLTNNSGFITIQDVPVQVNPDWNSNSGYSQILNKPTVNSTLYQSTAPENPQLNDIWVSSVTLIQYQWIGVWVNFNLQSLINIDQIIDGGGSIFILTETIDGGNSNSIITNIINSGNA